MRSPESNRDNEARSSGNQTPKPDSILGDSSKPDKLRDRAVLQSIAGPWMFSLLILPLGISVGFKFTPLPFLLAQAGVPFYRIATIASIVHLPAVLGFLWASPVDTKLRRRIWLVLGALGTSSGLWIAFPLIGPTHLNRFLLTLAFCFMTGGPHCHRSMIREVLRLQGQSCPPLAHKSGLTGSRCA
jgi:hypothetical protein